MSDREKKLLIFFGAAGFLILNFLGFRFAMNKLGTVENQRKAAELQLANAEMIRNSGDQILGEMEWLDKNLPEPAASQDVQTKLQKFVESEALAAGLTIKTQKPLPTQAGGTFHRAKFQFVVSGRDEAFYRWFSRINDPTQLRAVTQILLSPNKQDDTQLDGTITVEQWFIPPTT